MRRRREVGPTNPDRPRKDTRGEGFSPSPREDEVGQAGFLPASLYLLARFSMGSKSRMAPPVWIWRGREIFCS